jgi:FKBP-type peptidyl-prolyl cis-trans isomerase SlyD
MKVAKDLVVSLAYQVRTEDGVLVDESPVSAPLDYLHGHGSLISGLENALDGHEVGDKFDVAVGANDAYGQYDENLVQRVPKDVFMGVDELQVGMRFLAETDQGPVPVEITEVEDDHVVVDGNHMLAGQNLKFNVEVVAIREATAEELEHGHVHGAHGTITTTTMVTTVAAAATATIMVTTMNTAKVVAVTAAAAATNRRVRANRKAGKPAFFTPQ